MSVRTASHSHFRRLLLLVLATIASCVGRQSPPPPTAVPSLGLDGPATYRAYLDRGPRRFKMRHQVESTFAGRTEVIEGFLVVERPDRFYVNARSPIGPALFEVKAMPPAPLAVTTHLAELSDERMARYLARDIRRMYLQECPADTPAADEPEGFAISCPLAPADDAIAGDDGPDDALVMHFGRGAEVRRKVFSRQGRATAVVSYSDLRLVGGAWLAHAIELEHQLLPYRMHIALLGADLDFDTGRVFGRREQ
jgi:hypothetical protein